MIRATFEETIGSPWLEMAPVRVGELPSGLGTPNVYVTVERDGSPILRVDVYEREPACHAFQEVIAWGEHVVIGYGDRVHFVSMSSGEAQTHAVFGYFGHLYPAGDRLLVADSERIHCFDSSGSRLWCTTRLGIDGVVVRSVDGAVARGEGDWDPPGGWQSFRVLLSSGARV